MRDSDKPENLTLNYLSGQIQGLQVSLAIVIHKLAESSSEDSAAEIATAMKRLSQKPLQTDVDGEFTHHTLLGFIETLDRVASMVAEDNEPPHLTVLDGGKSESNGDAD